MLFDPVEMARKPLKLIPQECDIAHQFYGKKSLKKHSRKPEKASSHPYSSTINSIRLKWSNQYFSNFNCCGSTKEHAIP